MKKLLLIMMVVLTLPLAAQDAAQPTAVLKYGYLSYNAVLQALPAYANVQTSMEQLRSQYAAEQQRVENDFNAKYEEFLDGQSSFPKTILQKRQSELQELLDRNIAFKKQSQQLLEKAEAEALEPVKAQLADALQRIGQERGYAFILNTDANATPWLNSAQGDDITDDVLQAIK